MSFIYLDIETLPAIWMSTTEREELAHSKVPKNIKDPAKIAARVQAGLIDPNGAFARTSCSPTMCVLYSVGIVLDDRPTVRVAMERYDCEPHQVRQREAQLMQRVQAEVDALYTDSIGLPEWVAHNGRDFDFPILRLRALRDGLSMAHGLPHSGRYGSIHSGIDTMHLAQGTARSGRGGGYGLEDLCKFFGIKGKQGMDGSQVYPAWLAQEHDRVAKYQARDVTMLRDLHRALIGLPGEMT